MTDPIATVLEERRIKVLATDADLLGVYVREFGLMLDHMPDI
ncbi:hypothetical protein OG206_00680 [Streptomyces sp. NBC_01341]|nr:hypothetical protein OG206_00680 [Streptomyces sp. NBC_01341]